MSSAKKINLATSEPGQLKAPDKWESSSKITNATTEIASDTMSGAKVQPQQLSRDAQKSNSSTQQDAKNLDLDDTELKNLLDEAYSYKGPKDKENKSAIFKELLHKAELEDQQQDTFFSSRQFRGSSRRHHQTGGSLQDLVDSVNNERLLDYDYILGPQGRRHQQNSRYTKINSSSVSSRQSEGGSLPNNVNASSCYPVSTFSVSKYPKVNAKNNGKNKSESHDYERSVTNHHLVNCLEEIEPPLVSASLVSTSNDKNHTIIDIEDQEEGRHLLAHDSLAQDSSEANQDEGTELVSMKKQRVPTMNLSPTNVKDIGESSRPHCQVDDTIQFWSTGPSTAEITQMSSKAFIKSAVEPKYPGNRLVHSNPTQINQSKLDENGNSIPPKTSSSIPPKSDRSKRNNKADRNTKTWTVEGQKSDYNIDSVVAFIENKDITKKNILNMNKNNLSATDRNRKEKKNNSKKEVSRLKKSTSMEELKSNSKSEEEIAQSERNQVSLRQKQLQNTQKRSVTTDSKDSTAKQLSNKRGERRSWGTEELNDYEPIEDRDTKKQKETKANMKIIKKSEQIASTHASVESILTNCEAAEFHVVTYTKKKKTKKRQIFEEAKAKQQQNRNEQSQTNGRYSSSNTSISNRYQPSSTYTNDRDIYVNSFTNENRRKSTSSVPPSDKSDSSDLDSVHSLPIESTTTSTSISYAEIARKANQPEKIPGMNAWPAVSQHIKSNESSENSYLSTSSSTISSRSIVSNRSQDTIKAASPVEEKTSANLDESRTPESQKLQTATGENIKNQLQKSKSCDNEKYTATMSLDQFPGLEKTVKPQKSQPNFASILTSPPPTATPPAISSEKTVKIPAAKKIPTSAEVNLPKETTLKTQKNMDEAPEIKNLVDINNSKVVFLQSSSKAEEIANSNSCNLFVPIITSSSAKKIKKLQQNSVQMQANVIAKTTQSQKTPRQTAVVFSDSGNTHENVSPLLFGDFNDDILLLMKQEENHVANETINGRVDAMPSNGSCENTFKSADPMKNCSQSKPIKMSSQSDPTYASGHHTTVPTESHKVVGVHQVHTELDYPMGSSTMTELSNKKSAATKKTSLNKINVNNKNSDVVSNQSLNNNSINNISLRDTNAKHTSVSESISDSDSLNNNVTTQMNNKNRNHIDGDVRKAQPHPSNSDISKSQNTQNTVHNIIISNHASNCQQNEFIRYDGINCKAIDNTVNGALPSTENDVVPVNSHPTSVSQTIASYAENQMVTLNHNHNDIVNFVGSAWEEVKFGHAHYFNGQ